MDWDVDFTLSWDWEKGSLVLQTPQDRTSFFTGDCAALSRVFSSWCLRFQPQNSRHSPSPPVTYLCERSSLRHGADVGSFLLPCVGVRPWRRIWGVDRPGEWEEGSLSHFISECCGLLPPASKPLGPKG